jgi:hypothetical protein
MPVFRSLRERNCDTDYYLVVAKFRERLAVNKQRSHRFNTECIVKKLKEVQGKGEYSIKVSNRFAALEHLDSDMKIISA